MAPTLFGPPRTLHGSSSRRNGAFNLVLVAEGYVQSELGWSNQPNLRALFWQDAMKLVDALAKEQPFKSFPALLNVFALPVESAQSGQLVRDYNPVPEALRKTAFKFYFGAGGIARQVNGEKDMVRQAVQDAGLGFAEHILVIVNCSVYGGHGPTGMGWLTTGDPTWPRVAIHELGHSGFHLSDEYQYLHDEDTDPLRTSAGAEPSEPNVTRSLDLQSFKWRSLVTSFTPWPSTVPHAAGQCTRPHPLQPGVAPNSIGAFEGADHFDCDTYRPAERCLMRNHAHAFCAVCAREIVPTRLPLLAVDQRNPSTLNLPTAAGQNARWTHFVSLPDPRRPSARRLLLLYDATTGQYELYDLYELWIMRKYMPAVFGSIETDLVVILPTLFNGQLELTGFRFAPPARIQYRIGSGLASIQKLSEDFLPLGTPTHAALAKGASQLALTYNRFTGQAVLQALNAAAQSPMLIAAEVWEKGWSLILPLAGWASDFVLCYDWRSGQYAIRGLPSTFGIGPPAVWSSPANSAPLAIHLTHAIALAHETASYVVTYSAFTGFGALFAVRSGGLGLDYLGPLRFDAGAPLMPTLGQGLAALDLVDTILPQADSVGTPWLALYSRDQGRAISYATFGQP